MCSIARQSSAVACCSQKEADDLSDNEVDSICHHAEAVARVIVEMFLAQRAGAE
jgi:hypothetical protein